MRNESVDASGQVIFSTVPPVDVPLNVWRYHPVLRNAQLNLNQDHIEWPRSTYEQLPLLRNIVLVDEDGTLCARLSAQFNFDRFVDAQTDENAPAHPPGHTDDYQRFYTRVTESGFHFVGVFSALTIGGRRRYFQWLTSSWVEVGLSGFLHARDALETHFSEVSADQLDASQRGASSTPIVVVDEWMMESPQSQFLGEPSGRRAAAHRLPVPAEGEAPIEQKVSQENQASNESQVPAEGHAPTGSPVPPELHEPAQDHAPAEREYESDISTEATSSLPAGTVPMDFATQEGIAVAIATIVHRGDVDFGGASSIDHVARVAESFDRESESVRYCAAWLHDVLDVGALFAKDLLDAGVSPEIVHVVSLLTKAAGADEDSWLEAIASHPDAHAVKARAVADNSAAWRLRRLDPSTRAEVEASCARARSYLTEMVR